MKIMQIMLSRGDGGLEKHFAELSNGLAAQGHVVVAVADESMRSKLTPQVQFEPVVASRNRRDPRLLFALARLVKRHRPDICHAQASKAAQVVSLARKLTAVRPRYVTTIHNLKKNLAFVRAFDLVIGVSKQLTSGVPKGTRATVIYNGIQQTQVRGQRAEPSPKQNGPLQWLAVGRLVEAKGFDTLLEAMAELPHSLMIAGEGPHQQTLETLIVRHKLQDRVTLLGHRTDVPQLMSQADAVVISSRREGFSYVFAEALLSHVPVVSTDVPIPNEVLPPHLICPTESPHLLARLMATLNPEAADHAKAFDFAESQLTLSAMVSNTEAAYTELLSEPEVSST